MDKSDLYVVFIFGIILGLPLLLVEINWFDTIILYVWFNIIIDGLLISLIYKNEKQESENMGIYDERIAKAVMDKIGDKIADEFDKVSKEFKRMEKAINELEERIDNLEK